ncbi:MAG: hypothetical protein Q8S29_04150 [Phreatobacter sp.]|nr:hypothetical protein [Phreatobacter sp.]
MRAQTLAAWMMLAAAGAAFADEPFNRPPTGEEQRMIELVLKAEGFSPCSAITLVASQWSCRTKNAEGQDFQVSLSNVDFAVLGRQRVQ